MTRPTHPKKEIEEALRHAEGHGWRIEVGGSHAWGGFTARPKTWSAVAVSSASLRYGARRRTQATTRER